MTNEAVIRLPRGFGFHVSATSDAGAHNFAAIGLRRNGVITPLGIIEPGAPSRTVRAIFSDAEIIVAGFAGNYAKSTLHPNFNDPFPEKIVAIPFDDAFGSDRDFNDLVVHITRFQSLTIAAVTDNTDRSELLELDNLEAITLHPAMPKIEELIRKIDAGDPVSAADYSDLPVISESLNEEERRLFNQDPILGGRVFIEAKAAIAEASSLYHNDQLHNGNGDAFRHMYWNFLMARNTGIGDAAAKAWATAHESDAQNPALEKTMDLHNNQVGRKLASSNVDDNPADLRASVRIGSCRIIKDGVLTRSDNQGEV